MANLVRPCKYVFTVIYFKSRAGCRGQDAYISKFITRPMGLKIVGASDNVQAIIILHTKLRAIIFIIMCAVCGAADII